MGILKKKEAQPVATDVESASLPDGNEGTGAKAGTVEHAKRWLEAVKGNSAEAAALEAKARADLAQAQEKHAASVTTFEAAVDRYNDDESEGNAKAVRAAREARDLAEAQLQRRQKAADEASNGLKVAEDAVSSAEAEVKAAGRVERIAELSKAASVQTFRKVARPATERFMKARDAMHRELDALVSAYESGNIAAGELLAMGEPARKLDPIQLLAEYCLLAAEKDPTLVDGFTRSLQLADNVPRANQFSGETLRDSLERHLVGRPGQALIDRAGRRGRTETCRAGRGDCSCDPSDISELHDFFRNTRGAWAERTRERLREEEIERQIEANGGDVSLRRAQRLAKYKAEAQEA